MFARCLLLGCFLTLSTTALSIERSGKLKSGRFELVPTVGLLVEDDSNFLKSVSNDIDVTLTEYSPQIRGEYSGNLLNTTIAYTYFSGNYSGIENDDYEDHHLSSELGYQLTRKGRFDLLVDYKKEHENRSISDLDFNPNGLPNEYDESKFKATYTYGRSQAKGQFRFFASVFDREYTNNRINTIDEDRAEQSFGGSFYLRISPRMRAFVEATQTQLDYDFDKPITLSTDLGSLDSTRSQYFSGLSWKLTNKTIGNLKLGYAKRDFDSSRRQDFSGLSWQLDTSWNINALSTLHIKTARSDRESGDGAEGGYIDEKSYAMDWEKFWGKRIATTLSAVLYDRDYVDYVQSRDDTLVDYGLRIDYSLFKWLDIGVSAHYSDNQSQSDTGNFDYERERFGLHIVAGF